MYRSLSHRTLCCLALPLLAAACRSRPPAADITAVATAGDATLTTAAIAIPFGQSRRPLRSEELRAAVELWVDYQLLARAAAAGDTISDPAIVEAALWGPIANAKAGKWYRRVQGSWPGDTTSAEAAYLSGRILTARQILLDVPERAMPYERMVIRARVDSLRQRLTPENFAAVASRISADSLSRTDGGQLPAWPAGRGIMLPEFETAIQITKPGTISGIVSTRFGVHILYRPTWAEAERFVRPAARELAKFRAESTYFAVLLGARAVQVSPGVAALARRVALHPDRYADSSTVLATMRGGDFTAATLVRWLRAYPPAEGIVGQLTNAPDTLVPEVLRRIIRNELFVQQADSAGVTLTSAERSALDADLRLQLESAVGTLGLDRRMVPDSIRALPEATRRAWFARRVTAQFASILQSTAAPVVISPTVRQLLRSRYRDVTIDDDALARALDAARRVRVTRDSTRNNAPADSASRTVKPAAPTA